MKKIALFVSVLLLAGSLFAAAPVFEAKPGISGNATLTFGVDLNNPVATGFANATDLNITLGLINKDADEKGGKDGEEVYGWIKLKDFEMKIAAGDTPTLTTAKPGVEAKLFLGPVYINILGDANSIDKASLGWGKDVTPSNVFGLGLATTEANNAFTNEYNGLILGLKDTSVVDVSLGVASKYDWSATTNPPAAAVTAGGAVTYKTVLATYTLASNELYVESTGGFTSVQANAETVINTVGTTSTTYYVVGVFATPAAAAAAGTPTINNGTGAAYNFVLKAGLKVVPDLTLDVAANLSTATGAAIGVGVKAAYKIAIAEGISIQPLAGFEIALPTVGSTTLWDLAAGIRLALPGDKKGDYDAFNATKTDIQPGLGVAFTYDSASKADLEVSFFDGTLIPVVDMVAVAELYNLTGTQMKLGLGVDLSAALDGGIKPYAKVQVTNTGANVASDYFKLSAGVELKVITNTTLTLDYTSANLLTTGQNLGQITFATKIAY